MPLEKFFGYWAADIRHSRQTSALVGSVRILALPALRALRVWAVYALFAIVKHHHGVTRWESKNCHR
jgi:hypothetical protein